MDAIQNLTSTLMQAPLTPSPTGEPGDPQEASFPLQMRLGQTGDTFTISAEAIEAMRRRPPLMRP
jgi:hypothetical protein